MYIMDCTSSMTPWIEECKESVLEILEKIKEENPECKIRMSFVGYRDFDQSEEHRFKIFDFNEDVDLFKNFLGKVRARGGADLAEDVCGGFEKALEQSWGQDSTKVAIFVADCPCHGSKYHNESKYSDFYRDGDPDGRNIELQIIELAKKQIDFYAIKIQSDTD